MHKYPRHNQKLITRKRCIWRQHRKYPDNKIILERYDLINDECRCAIRNFEIYQERKVIDSGSSGQFFNYVNQKLRRNNKVGMLRDKTGNAVTLDSDKASTLNDYFSSVYTADDGITPDFKCRVNDECDKLEGICFVLKMLVKICKN